MATIGIIGWGVVGKATGDGFSKGNKILWHDPYVEGSLPLADVIKESEFIFICLPTPMYLDERGIDLSIIRKMVAKISPKVKNTNKIVIIKSTVVPGTTAALAKKYPQVKFAMNPEFLTEINAAWDFTHTDRVVIGAINEEIGIRIARLYRQLLGYEMKIFVTDTTTAEMVKYMANTYMATKVVFANEMKEFANKLGINYDEVRKMVASDPRIGDSFLGVTPFRGFGGKCFPKDVVAFLGLARKKKVNLSVLEAVWKKNLQIRKIRDWEEIEGAVNHQSSRKATAKK